MRKTDPETYCTDCKQGSQLSVQVTLCRIHRHTRELYDMAYWIVNGDPRQSYGERLSGIQKRAKGLLKIMGDLT